MVDIYGGLSTRYVFHHLDALLQETTHKDEFGNIDLQKLQKKEDKIRILDIGCGTGAWGYHIRTKYPNLNIELMGFDIDEESMVYPQEKNIYDTLGFYDAREGTLPFDNKSLDIVIACGFMNSLSRRSGVVFLSELKRISHSAIVTVPNTLWKVKDIKKSGNWNIRSFGLNIPKNRRPTLFDHFMDPIIFGFSRYKTYFWAKEHFCWFQGESEMPTIERSVMGKEKIVMND